MGQRPSIYRLTEPDPSVGINNLRSVIHQSARDGKVVTLEADLAKWPAAVNLQDMDGMSPLHYACRYGNLEAVRVLLKRGALPNMKNSDGDTPLHLASKYHQGFSDICSITDESGRKVMDRLESERTANSATKNIIRALVEGKA